MEMISVPLSAPAPAPAPAPRDTAPAKGDVIYPAFCHSASSINRHLCGHSTMINDGRNYGPNSQQVTKASSGSQKNGIR